MAKTFSKVLLVTANVGSIFEEPEKMVPIWLREFLAVVASRDPEFLAIHCQEVGGKNYEESMQHVNKFITMLLDSKEMQQFDRAKVFLDEDFTAVEKFTALGSLYFVHKSVKLVEIFDFQSNQFVPVEGKELLTGNIENVRIKEKSKFAKEFFPDFVWSRKGFIRTRWNLYNTKFDLINIHLIHDVSNVAAMESSPSTYSKFRERALQHTLERFEGDKYEKYPFFVFGDFNFRMDTHRLIKHLIPKAEEQKVVGKKNEVAKVLFKHTDNGNVLLTVGKKDFKHLNHKELFSTLNAMKLQQFDNEPSTCYNKLFEYPVTFPPSYPFSEDFEDGTSYMPTRCPGWCDRIMMSHTARDLIDNGYIPEYKMIGSEICMGDHKPIYLNLKVRVNPPPYISGNPPLSQDVPLDMTGIAAEGEEAVGSKPPVKQLISINGELVEVTPGAINIHDFTTFEQEEVIARPDFFDKMKRPSKDNEGLKIDPAGASRQSGKVRFKNAINSLIKSESVIRAIRRHYAHRSDSESDYSDTEGEACSKNGGGDTSPSPTTPTKTSPDRPIVAVVDGERRLILPRKSVPILADMREYPSIARCATDEDFNVEADRKIDQQARSAEMEDLSNLKDGSRLVPECVVQAPSSDSLMGENYDRPLMFTAKGQSVSSIDNAGKPESTDKNNSAINADVKVANNKDSDNVNDCNKNSNNSNMATEITSSGNDDGKINKIGDNDDVLPVNGGREEQQHLLPSAHSPVSSPPAPGKEKNRRRSSGRCQCCVVM